MKSIASAKNLAAGEAIDEGEVLLNAVNEIHDSKIDLWIVVDTKHLFATLSTCRVASDRSIRGDVSSIRFEFFTKVFSKTIWVPGSTNLAACGTEPDIPLTNFMQLLLVSGSIPIDLKDSISLSSLQFTG